jgi:hypothetical protein
MSSLTSREDGWRDDAFLYIRCRVLMGNMDRDIRNSDLYCEVEALCLALRRPASGQIGDAAEVHVAPDGDAVFSGSLMDRLEGLPVSRVCMIALDMGELKVMTFGPSVDRSLKFSPDGRQVAFLSDRHAVGDFQLYLLDLASGAAQRATPVDGSWSTCIGRRTAS